MIISIVILVGGLSLFYRMIAGAQNTVKTYDVQFESMIKDMMTDGARTAVYPADPKIGNGDSAWIGVGVTNIYDDEITFTVKLVNVKYHITSGNYGTDAPGALQDYYDISSQDVTIPAHEKIVKGVLLRMPKMSPAGYYVYTINITKGIESYGLVEVIASNK